MKNFVIIIRGAGGSGKTTIAREYLNLYKIEEQHINIRDFQVPINICKDNVIILGRYIGNKVDGCDIYNKEEILKEIILTAIKKYKPKYCVLENCLLSTKTYGVLRLNQSLKQFGYDLCILRLKLSYDERIKRLQKRKGKEVLLVRHHNIIKEEKKSSDKLKKAGLKFVEYDTTNTPIQNMYMILDEAIKSL